MEAGWLVAVIITPLFFNVYSSRVFEPDKVALLRSLARVMLAAWVVKSVSERAVGSGPSLQKLTTSWKAPLVVPVLAFAIVYLLSTALSVAPTRSLLGSYHRLQGTLTTLSYLVLFALVATHLRSRQQLERVLTAVVLTSLSVSIYAIFQRSGWDPLPWPSAPWAGSRTFASLGHPIFLGAYLMMAVFVVLGRLTTSVQAVLAGDPRRRFHTGRAAAYSAIVIVNLTAIAFTQSRGPVIGLYAGLVCYWLLLAAVGYARRLAVAALVLLAVPAVFVALLNVPDGPLRAMREWEGVSRFGQILDTREGSVRGRALIWNGVVTLMTPHAALEYPDGSPDRWNGLRPLVGYGPETLSVVFERFHPPELARLEGRSDSAWCCFVDRTHNETFDALVTTGALGVIVYLGLFAAIFYYGVTWLGLLAGRTRRLVCVCLTLGSTAVSAAVLSAWQGPAFLGLAVPVGMVAGLLTYLAVSALPVETAAAGARRTEEGGPAGTGAEPWRVMALVSLLSAIVAYFIETSFGIATVSTYAHFWIFAGLMLAVGRGTSDSHRAQDDVAGLIPSASPPPPWRDAMVTAGMLTVILVTLGYNYTALGSPAGPRRHRWAEGSPLIGRADPLSGDVARWRDACVLRRREHRAPRVGAQAGGDGNVARGRRIKLGAGALERGSHGANGTDRPDVGAGDRGANRGVDQCLRGPPPDVGARAGVGLPDRPAPPPATGRAAWGDNDGRRADGRARGRIWNPADRRALARRDESPDRARRHGVRRRAAVR